MHTLRELLKRCDRFGGESWAGLDTPIFAQCAAKPATTILAVTTESVTFGLSGL